MNVRKQITTVAFSPRDLHCCCSVGQDWRSLEQ